MLLVIIINYSQNVALCVVCEISVSFHWSLCNQAFIIYIQP